jgi:CelD/BcsL family acetyltransferase involved in cellulose biosynthesis
VIPGRRRDVLPFGISGLHLNTTGSHDTDIITIEYNGFLVDRDCAGIAATAAVAFLLDEARVGGRGYEELHLKSVPLSYGAELRHPGLTYRELARKPSYRIDLDAVRAGGAGYLAMLRANTRQKLRQSLRLYERQGRLAMHRAADVTEALAFFDALGALHQDTWQARGEPGAFSYAFFVQFHRALIADCQPRGEVEIVRVSCGDTPIGYIYNFLYRGQVLFYLSGFRYAADARLKPGLVTHLMCIEAHLQEGASTYDFMEGEARYKASLGRSGPDSIYLLVQRRTWPVRLENGLRRLKQRVLQLRSGERETTRAHS